MLERNHSASNLIFDIFLKAAIRFNEIRIEIVNSLLDTVNKSKISMPTLSLSF